MYCLSFISLSLSLSLTHFQFHCHSSPFLSLSLSLPFFLSLSLSLSIFLSLSLSLILSKGRQNQLFRIQLHLQTTGAPVEQYRASTQKHTFICFCGLVLRHVMHTTSPHCIHQGLVQSHSTLTRVGVEWRMF